MYQAFQYRIQPTVEQEAALAVQFGHARFVYNWALQQRIQVYQQTKKSLSFSQLCKLLTHLKQQPDYLWLNDAYSQCLQQKRKDLGRAFTHFFEGHARFPKQRTAVGLDLGLTHFLTTSQGEQVENPRWLRRSERKLAKLQRKLQRKQKGSKNREKARLQSAKQAEGVSHQRRDFQHKLSKRLVREHPLLVFEDLNVRGMVKNRRLAKSIHDAAWSQFVRFCEYKGAWYGCDVVKVGRFFASSKLCSCCGWKHESLRLKDRAWTCGGCGTHHDRDKKRCQKSAPSSLVFSLVGTHRFDVCGDCVRRLTPIRLALPSVKQKGSPSADSLGGSQVDMTSACCMLEQNDEHPRGWGKGVCNTPHHPTMKYTNFV